MGLLSYRCRDLSAAVMQYLSQQGGGRDTLGGGGSVRKEVAPDLCCARVPPVHAQQTMCIGLAATHGKSKN